LIFSSNTDIIEEVAGIIWSEVLDVKHWYRAIWNLVTFIFYINSLFNAIIVDDSDL
jgi:hypothetical protein